MIIDFKKEKICVLIGFENNNRIVDHEEGKLWKTTVYAKDIESAQRLLATMQNKGANRLI